MEGLGFDNIFGESEIENLFTSDEATEETVEKPDPEETTEEGEEKNGETDKTTEVDPDDLFEEGKEEKPESVGSEEIEGKEKVTLSIELQSAYLRKPIMFGIPMSSQAAFRIHAGSVIRDKFP